MTQIRDPAVAGSFYPQEPIALQQQLDGFLSQKPRLETKPKALIVPHAGYIYSGAIAGKLFSQVAIPDRVILLGPNHHGTGHAGAVSSVEAWVSPFGDMPVDRELASEISAITN